MVHVQRDGKLLIKDPKRWPISDGKSQAVVVLLVEVRDSFGKTVRNVRMQNNFISIGSNSGKICDDGEKI